MEKTAVEAVAQAEQLTTVEANKRLRRSLANEYLEELPAVSALWPDGTDL